MTPRRQWIVRLLTVVTLMQCVVAAAWAPPHGMRRYEAVRPAQETFQRDILVEGLQFPWAMDFLPDGHVLVTEHGGRLLHIDAQKHVHEIRGLPTNIADIGGQAGLLDVAVAPDFARTQRIYLSYVAQKFEAGEPVFVTCVMRARINFSLGLLERRRRGAAKPFCATPWGKEMAQFGGALALDDNGHLFLSVGDRGQRDTAQNPQANWGKILRLPLNLAVPDDNPFGKGNAVWSLGHRNPQGLFFDTRTRRLYESEHGPRGGDEINLIKGGKNYGWPVISYGAEYVSGEPVGEGTAKPGMEQPLYYYVPSIATSAIAVYNAHMFPEWRGTLFVGALGGQHLNHLYLENGVVVREERLLHDMGSRIRDVKQGPDGALYVLLEKGTLLRLRSPFRLKSKIRGIE